MTATLSVYWPNPVASFDASPRTAAASFEDFRKKTGASLLIFTLSVWIRTPEVYRSTHGRGPRALTY